MGQPVIRVENLSKEYRIGKSGSTAYRTIRETINDALTRPLRSFRGARYNGRGTQSFWALSDVSFEIAQGEVAGVIGVNGAGKSTLLKILSHITEPTTGRSAIRGRVASLLEVGTGFHPELSGRENVLLNGAILGMKRSEILRKFDQIVEFAGVSQFVDTPVKRYSSGMYVRLAFAVAAHLEPEVLIIDEVLSVGDIAFQTRCIGRMREVSQEGRTVLIVSHNLVSIESLCGSCLLLDGGKLVSFGSAEQTAREYRRRITGDRENGTAQVDLAEGSDGVPRIFKSLTLTDSYGDATTCFPLGGPFRLAISMCVPDCGDLPVIVIRIDDSYGQRMMTIKNPGSRAAFDPRDGSQIIECCIPDFPLAPGEYWVGVALYVNEQLLDEANRAINFTVVNSDAFGSARGASNGICVARSEWRTIEAQISVQ